MAKISGLITPPLAAEEGATKIHSDNSSGGGGVATGAMLMFAGSSAPSGYLIADGSAISRTTYAALFAAISTAHGAGDGSTTFNIPNMQGRFAVGRHPSGNLPTLGATGGTFDHVHSQSNHTHAMAHTHSQSHEHTISHSHTYAHTHSLQNHVHYMQHTHTIPNHAHGFSLSTNSYTHGHTLTTRSSTAAGTTAIRGSDNAGTTYSNGNTTFNSASHSHTVTGNIGPNTAGDGLFTSSGVIKGDVGLQPNDYTNGSSAGSTDSGGGTTDSISTSSSTSISNTTTGGASTANTGNPTAATNTGSANSPFIALNYIIKT
jgi:microcystin-dependent protein